MSQIALLVRKDLLRKLRSPLGLIAALSFPLVFAGLIALSFGRGGGVPKVRMLVANQDDGIFAGALAAVFTSSQGAAYFDGKAVTEEQGRALMDEGKASAFLTIPKGFTRDVLDAKPVTLTLVRNPSEGILPEIAEQTTGSLADILDGGRRVFDAPLSKARPLFDRENGPTDDEIVKVALGVKQSLEGTGRLLFPPAITLESELLGTAKADPKADAKKNGDAPSAIFLIVLPGVAVYGLFLIADQGMRDVMTERTLGTLRRQLAGPVRAETVIAAKAIYTGVLAAAAIVVMGGIGATVLAQTVSVAAFLALSAAAVVAVTGTTALIYGVARTERQAATLGNMIFVLMGFLGGGFIRVAALPPAVRGIAPFLPLYWATEGYRAILENGAGVAGVAKHVVVLLAMGSVFLAVGAAAIRRSARAGA